MTLQLGNTQAGQFFTPPENPELMVEMTYGDELVNVILSHGHDPAKRLWTYCQDVDRT